MSGPIDPRYQDVMRELADLLDDVLNGFEPPRLPGLPRARSRPRTTGFFLAVFPFNENGEEGRFNYISNADRLDVITLLTEMRARFAGDPEVGGSA